MNITSMNNSTYKNRGMFLENILNDSNTYYNNIEKCLIYKKPTPIRITKTNYKNMRITDGFFESPSTLDYNGVYKGYYIEFDAKETRSKTSFPIDNIHKHQIEYIRKVIKHNGIVFLIVRFSTLNRDFVISGKDIIDYINNNERKSIEYNYIKEKGYKISESYTPRLKYLDTVDKAYFN